METENKLNSPSSLPKQSSIEWLIEELTKNGFNFINYMEEVNQAKEMHKQEVIDANNRGYKVGRRDIFETAEQYYNETFKI